jgi:hypothetical protein
MLVVLVNDKHSVRLIIIVNGNRPQKRERVMRDV